MVSHFTLVGFLFALSNGLETSVLPDGVNVTNCVFLRKERLVCDIVAEAKENFNCTVGLVYRKNYNERCPVHLHPSWPTASGVCEYSCVNRDVNCLHEHLIILKWYNPTDGRIHKWCRTVHTQDLWKPGPVVGLSLTPVNSTSVKVSFKKPKDRVNEDDVYRYNLKYISNSTDATWKKVKRRSKEKDLNITLNDLEPARNYTVIVVARPKAKGFKGDRVKRFMVTLEDVPLSSPIVPKGAFSIISKDAIAVYWKDVPSENRRGWIQRMNISVEPCSFHQSIQSGAQYLAEVNLTTCESDQLYVRTNAKTEVGWSRTSSVTGISLELFDHHRVRRVYKTSNQVVWDYLDATDSVTSFSVFWCYGYQDMASPQLVLCKVPIDYMTVPASNRTTPLEARDVPDVDCTPCDWHYAVAVNIRNTSAGMVWNTPNITAKAYVQGVPSSVAAVTAISALLVIAAILLVVLCIKFKKKLFCEKVFIILPKMSPVDLAVSVDHSATSCKQVDTEKATISLLRDSGNSTMLEAKFQNEFSRHLSPSEDTDSEKEEIEDPLCHTGPWWSASTTEDDQWPSTDTSGMSDYRQVACEQQPPDVPALYSGLGSVTSGSCFSVDTSAQAEDASNSSHFHQKNESSDFEKMTRDSFTRHEPLGCPNDQLPEEFSGDMQFGTPTNTYGSKSRGDKFIAMDSDLNYNSSQFDAPIHVVSGKHAPKQFDNSAETSIGSYAEVHCDSA